MSESEADCAPPPLGWGCPVPQEYNYTPVVAAGNEGAEAMDWSPANENSCVTMSSTDWSDRIPDFANVGVSVNMFAPGARLPPSARVGTTKRRPAAESPTGLDASVQGVSI